MLKKIVVVLANCNSVEFESEREYLSAHNKPSGELIIEDVRWRNHTPEELKRMSPEERETRRNNKLCVEEVLAVFKDWLYWEKIK